MRIAEILMALILAAVSLAIMYKAGERPDWSGEARFANVGFGEDGAPRGGFWPFWTCAIIVVCSVWVFINALLRRSGPSQSTGPFIDAYGVAILLKVALPVFLMVLLIDYISIYFSMALFLFYYLIVLGRHGLILSLAMAVILPGWLYLFFDIAMSENMPKGVLALEDGVYAPIGTALRKLDGTSIGLMFLAGGAILVAAAWLSGRRRAQ